MLESSTRPGTLRHVFMLVALLTAAVIVTTLRVSDARAATFTRGFADSVWIWPDNPSQTTQQWDQNAHAAGGRIAEVEVDWTRYEPAAPTSGDPGDPANPVYTDLTQLDSTIKTLEAAHVQPMLLITDAPGWAQANDGANGSTQGYEPSASALQAFAQALATRYAGNYPDPDDAGAMLPRVTYYQLWAEANLTIKLAPQWTKVGSTWVNTGATTYRNMLNGFYAGVKAGDPGDKVVFSGLEAYGDPAGTPNGRVAPVTFLENVLCLNAQLKKVCDTPAHFDVMATDPYDVGSPTTHAVSRTDASAPDMARLTKVLTAALRAGTALPDAHKPLWVTEFSYDSKPPNPAGLPVQKQARWLELALYTFWRQGVSTVLWYLIRDSAGNAYNSDYFSGIYYYDGKKKPSYTAYSFPLVVAASGNQTQFWGIAPGSGVVTVQRHAGSQWVTVAKLRRSAGAVFTGLLPGSDLGSYRAVEGKTNSLVWSY